MNRDEWLKERQKGIGASDAAAILGLSPYKTNIQLWEEKTGRTTPDDISDKPYVQYGIQAEEYLRGLFALDHVQYEVGYKEFDIVRNEQYPFIFATLDGSLIDEQDRNGILEIKTTEIMQAQQWNKWNDQVPENYYIQILHQLIATGFDFAILNAQIKYTDKNWNKCKTTRDYNFERSDLLIDLKYLLEREVEFWGHVISDKKPNKIIPGF